MQVSSMIGLLCVFVLFFQTGFVLFCYFSWYEDGF